MAATYVIDAGARIVRTTFTGIVTYSEVVGLATELGKDTAFSPDFSELAIFGEDCVLCLKFVDFVSLALFDPFSKNARRAFVSSSQKALYGVLRMFQAARENNPNLRILGTADEALTWLNGEDTSESECEATSA